MELSRRGFFAAGAAAAAAAAPAFVSGQETTAAPEPKPGQLTEEMLGRLLEAMGLKPQKTDQRYDFVFRSVHDREDWDLSMTAVLSADHESVWVMAWLDELPKSAADVPRTALLRLLAANDTLGNGKFFAYVATNRRFVLQRVVANENISTRSFATVLKDLGKSVVETYPQWSTANWIAPTTPETPVATQAPSAAGNTVGAGASPIRTASQSTGTVKQ